MKKYETYKDSGVKWIGEIPENWKSVKIKFITDIYTGNSLNSDLKILFESENENDLPYVSTKDIDIDNNTLNYNNGLRIPLDNSYYKVAPEGSFLLCIEGANAGKKMAYVEQDCCFVNKLACFNFPNKFLFYFAQSNSFKTQFFNSISGLIGGVSISVLKEFVSTIPSPKEQTQIAAYLDYKTVLIDAIIAQKEALIKKLKEQRQAIINEAVTKGLNPGVKLKDSGIEWLGEIPEHWEVVRLKYLLSEKLKYGANESAVDSNKEHPRYIRITDFGQNGNLKSDTYKSLSPAVAEEYLLNEGDILFARSGATVGKTFQFKNYSKKACFAGYLIKATVSDKITSDYLYFFTKSSIYDNWKNSVFVQATIQNISAEKYNLLPVSLPSVKEQLIISQHIINKTKEIDQTIKVTEISIQKLKEYRQSLISEAVTGKIDVRDWQAPKS
jgi:type I restriction enzyme, S subunit